jgi:iron complex outermembrane recepter protein
MRVRTYSPRRLAELLLTGLSVAGVAGAADDMNRDQKIFDMSIEELVSLEVTSVSRKAERLEDASSAVYVISQDDIRRSGARNLPEALRLAPGLAVLQIDANKWAVGSRGFVGRFANKLLVMIDGRMVYTPSFAGVFWDVQDTSLEDIERIEVIRGPGATIWGTNAVNGVINVITRRAGDDTGGSLSSRLETDGSHEVGLRFADSTAGGWDYRVFAKHQDAEPGKASTGMALNDDWRMSRIGGRFDHSFDEFNELALIAEAYDGNADVSRRLQALAPPYPFSIANDSAGLSGAFLTARWTTLTPTGARTEMQLVLDGTNRSSTEFSEDRRTVSLDVQHQRRLGRYELVMGAGYRHNNYQLAGSETISMSDLEPSDYTASAFLQAETGLLQDRLRLTLGSKFEENSLSNRSIEFLPSVRLLWQATPVTNVWGAVTRAARTPSLAEQITRVVDVRPMMLPGNPQNPFPVPLRNAILGNPDFGSEDVVSYELGLRSRIGESIAWSAAAFDMHYDRLRQPLGSVARCSPSGILVSTNPMCLFSSNSVVVETTMSNIGQGTIRGLELTADWALTSRWRLRGSWSLAVERIRDSFGGYLNATGPEQQASLKSDWLLTPHLTVGSSLRFVDRVPLQAIDSYVQADLQLNWQLSSGLDVTLVGRNLLNQDGPEYMSELNNLVPAEVEPVGYLQARWSF